MARLRAAGPEKVLVFTAFRQTLEALARELSGQGIPAAVYHGSLARLDKERAIRAFRDEVPVMLSTESAGEGRNLQFCHVMVNATCRGTRCRSSSGSAGCTGSARRRTCC